MSQTTDRPLKGDVLGLDSGMEALETSAEFRGPVEPLDGHHCNDHFAQIYERPAERFEASVPFIRHGLERDERCVYVVDEESEDEVLAAMREGGVDVDAERASGALTVHTVQETYLRNGTFDPRDMIDLYGEMIDETVDEYEALRIVAETTWLQEDETTIEQFMEYESRINDLFDDTDCIAICQYERDGFRPEVIRDIVQTHPHLIYRGTACHNFYYTPPNEFFSPDEPANEVDRMLGTLLERTQAKTALEDRERYLRRQNDVTGSPDLSFEEKLQELFELGCERFDMDLGGMARVDSEADTFEVEYLSGDHRFLAPGVELPLSETYCVAATEDVGPVSVLDPVDEGYGEIRAHSEFGIQTYLGTYVEVEGDDDRTFFFVSEESRSEPFSEDAHNFQRLLGQWAKYELESRQRERTLQQLYETTAAIDLSFEDKIGRLLELGCDRFDVECGLLGHLSGDRFDVVQAVGGNDQLEAGTTIETSETYCSRMLESSAPMAVNEASDEGWLGEEAYDRFGLESYLGTTVTVGGDLYGTLCFVGRDARDRTFTEAEETFIELLSQWIGYELEREHREAQLAALNEMSRDLMAAETLAEIADETVRHARETLQLPLSAVVRYDADDGRLVPAAQTPRAHDELPTAALCQRAEGPCWEAFVSGEVTVVDDVDSISGAGRNVTAAVAVPLGNQGLILTATESPDGFCPAELDFVEATGATVADACVRADRERKLQERERTLEEQNETLQRLNRVNDIIRNIDKSLVQASSRTDIEAVVCEQLADVGPYELAWIGEHDAVEAELVPREWAGAEKGYLEGSTFATDDSPEGNGPGGRAVKTGEPQVVNDILADNEFGPWRQAALNRGYHAAISLPLRYEGTLYGLLNIYAGQPGVFDELERTVLAELADNVAYSINAVESKKALVSNEVTELEFTIADERFPVLELVDRAGCAFAHEYVVPRSDGSLQEFFSTRGAAADEVLEAARRIPMSNVELIGERTEAGEPVCQFQGTLSEESLPRTVQEHGGQLHGIEAADGTATVTVHLAPDAAIREFVEMFVSRYPESQLTAQRSREQPNWTFAEFRTALGEVLTDRQLEVLQTAYFSGYFEQPRSMTGSEIADTLDISQPTFNAHLRVAQRKLGGQLFEQRPFQP